MNKKRFTTICTCLLLVAALNFVMSCSSSKKENSETTEATSKTSGDTTKAFNSVNDVEGFEGLVMLLAQAANIDPEDINEDDIELLECDEEDDDDGAKMPVAYLSFKKDIVFQLIDAYGDGIYDVAVCDVDNDDDISDDEIVDITKEKIKVSDFVECDDDDYCSTDDDDDDDYYGEETSTKREPQSVPSKQRREEAKEADLPDYVNNARVKAFIRKK